MHHSALFPRSSIRVFRFRGTLNGPSRAAALHERCSRCKDNKSSQHLVSSSSFALVFCSDLDFGTRPVPAPHHPRKIAVRNARAQCAPPDGRKVGRQLVHVANGIPRRRFCSVFQLPTGSLTKPYPVIRSSAVPLEWVLIDRSLTSSPSSPPVLAPPYRREYTTASPLVGPWNYLLK
ncbi:hypothetical protein F5144DRAFT_187831 [Chaetomium tenue]|uniref:Uncharacterized protein n=1 Tax=Chaetomium tenue TaxID=1854479 RepID=A0ACB7PBS0_9PEZI|nr:hypothetical protein F5144DRAFT_187831 [Chaetomium globosum]